MQLTTHSDYALRILIFCGSTSPDLVTISQVSDAYAISKHHVGKIITELGEKDFLLIKRGRNGGFTLSEKAINCSVGDVIRAMEPNFNLVECFRNESENNCPLTPLCKLKNPLAEAVEAFLHVLDQYSLQQIISSGTKNFFRSS